MVRLTRENIQKILNINEGFKTSTYYKSRNMEEENFYEISGGELHKRSVGKTSFSDSRYDKTDVCDLDQIRRFLRNNINQLNLSIQ